MSNVKHNKGFVLLITVIVICAIVLVGSVTILVLGDRAARTAFSEQGKHEAQKLADACAEIAIKSWGMSENPDTGPEGISVGKGKCVIISEGCPGENCVIKAEGSITVFGRIIFRRIKIIATVGEGGPGNGLLLGGGLLEGFVYTVSGGAGSHTITVRDNADPPNQPNTRGFTIASQALTWITQNQTQGQTPPKNNRGNVGDIIRLSGNGFCPYDLASPVNIRWNGANMSNCSYDSLLLDPGYFTNCAFTIPAAPYGLHQISGRDQGVALVCNARTSPDQMFFVEPKITITGQSCPNNVTINGTGFAANSTVTIIWDNTDTTTTRTTGANGSFTSTVTFNLPATGIQLIGSRDAAYNFAKNLTNPCN